MRPLFFFLSKVVFQSDIYIFCLLKYDFSNLSLNNCSNCSECKNKEASAFRFRKENSSLQKLLHTKICDIFSNKFSRGEQVKWLFLKESSGSCKTDFSCRKTSSQKIGQWGKEKMMLISRQKRLSDILSWL